MGSSGPRLAGKIGIAVVVALLACFAGSALRRRPAAPAPRARRPPPRAAPPARPPAPRAPAPSPSSPPKRPRASPSTSATATRSLSYTIGSTQPRKRPADRRRQLAPAKSSRPSTAKTSPPNVDEQGPLGRDHQRRPAGPQRPLQLPDQPAVGDRRRAGRAQGDQPRPPSASASPSTATPSRSSAPTNTGWAPAASAPPAPATPTRART